MSDLSVSNAMKRAVLIALTVTCLFPPCRTKGQIALEILDAPTHAFSFEPIYVTFEARNEAGYPVVVPASECYREGAFLEAGQVGQSLEYPRKHSGCTPERLVQLSPGDRWLFYQHLELGPEGDFEIQAALQSHGVCRSRPTGPNAEQLEPVRVTESTAPRYDCWSGEARSQKVVVVVKVPKGESDVAAAASLELDHVGWTNNWRVKLILKYRELLQRFPSSHYTYAAFFAAGGGRGVPMLNAVILQPDNPLNPWVAGAMARDLLYRNRPCGTPQPWGPGAPDDLDERIERVIAAYPPPEPVKAYLEQREAELAAEECPEEAPVGDAPADEGGEP